MKSKLTLALESLSVDSWATTEGAAEERGTVQAREGADAPQFFDCTCAKTCVCPSAYYWCGDGYQTLYSCTYTQNESCAYSRTCPPTA